jgi:hypothetical protein
MVQQSLWAGIKSSKVKVRRRAARIVRDHNITGLDRVLAKTLKHDDPVTAALAAGVLWTRKARARTVVKKLIRHPDPAVRQALATGLGLRPHRKWAAGLLTRHFSEDRNPAVRARALAALGKVRPGHGAVFTAAVRTLLAATRDANGYVRAEALAQLARMKRPDLWPQVRARLLDSNLGARLSVLRVLRRSRLRRTQCRLLARGKDLFLALRAATVLARKADPGFVAADRELAASVLKRAGGSDRWDVRAAACNAASAMKGLSAGRQAVLWGLDDRHPRVRLAAARTALSLQTSMVKAIQTLKALVRTRRDLAPAAAHILALRQVPYGLKSLMRLARRGLSSQKEVSVAMLGSLRKGLPSVVHAWAHGSWSLRLTADRVLWQWWRR